MKSQTRLVAVLNLLEGLSARWTATQFDNAHTVVQFIGEELQSVVEIHTATWGNALRFRLDLNGIYLSGIGQGVRCLLVGGDDATTVESLEQFWRKDGSMGLSLPLVFCVSAAALESAHKIIPPKCALLLALHQVRELLEGDHPQLTLKRFLREQISRRRLSLYNISMPATGASFFGRRRELAQFLDNKTTNYAVAGPGRIGKTSLLKRHRWNLARHRDPRIERVFEISFYSLPSTYSVAQHIARSISESNRSSQIQTSELVPFLKHCRNQFGGALELLLDETDEVCDSEAFQGLAVAAREGYVRLIMAGRKALYDYITRNDSALGGRSRLIRMEPLEVQDARELVRQPLGDMGISLREPARVVDHILQRSGRLPHLIQFYCQQLVEIIADRELDEVNFQLVESMESGGEFSQYFLSPLYEIKSLTSQALARVLLASAQTRFTTADVVNLAKTVWDEASPEGVRQVCDELVILNILAWEGGGYRVASEALRYFAMKAGLLK